MGLKKGQTNNPNGRPRTGEAFLDQLRSALKTVEGDQKKSLMQHAVEQAYKDNNVLIALLRKLIPDLNNTEITGLQEMLEAMRKKYE